MTTLARRNRQRVLYVIVHIADRSCYWSNKHGWVDFIAADEYKFIDGIRLPLDGRWMAIAAD